MPPRAVELSVDIALQPFADAPIPRHFTRVGPSDHAAACWRSEFFQKVRQQGRIVSVAVIIGVGVNSDGRREILGMDFGPSEAETF